MPVITLGTFEHAGARVTLGARRKDDTTPVDAIIVTTYDATNVEIGSGEFHVGFELPNDFVKGDSLIHWSKIQQQIKGLRETGKVADAAAQEVARDRLREQLANLSVEIDQDAGAFLGIAGVGFLNLTVTSSVSIDLRLIDPDLSPPPSDDAAVLTARLRATGTAKCLGHSCDGGFLIDVVVSRGGLVQAIPSMSIDLPATARIPPFDFRWPRIDWPTLSWEKLDLDALLSILRFDLPIPTPGQFAQPLRIHWITSPTIRFALDAYKHLTLTTTRDGEGTLDCESIKNGASATTTIGDIHGFNVSLLAGGAFSVQGTLSATSQTVSLPRTTIKQPDALPFIVDIDPGTLTIDLSGSGDFAQAVNATISATLELPRVLIRAKSDPTLLLAVELTYLQKFDSGSGSFTGQLTQFKLVEPYPLALVALVARETSDAAAGLIRLFGSIQLHNPNLPDTGLTAVFRRLAAMLGAAVKWLVRPAGSVVDALLGVASAIADALENAVDWLFDSLRKLSTTDPHLAIEVRLDSRTFALRQIVISPAWTTAPTDVFTSKSTTLDLSIPLDWRPSLLIDLDGPTSVALVALEGSNVRTLSLGTDLWLTGAAGTESIADTTTDGKRPEKRILQADVTLKSSKAIVVARVCGGKATFLEALDAKVDLIVDSGVSVSSISGPIAYVAMDWSAIDVKTTVTPDRLLPFLQSSKGNSGPSFLDTLGQYVSIETGQSATAKDGVVDLPITAKLRVRETEVDLPFTVELTLKTFECHLKGAEPITVWGNTSKSSFDLFGLTGKIVWKGPPPEHPPHKGDYPFFSLDFSGGDVRMSLAKNAELELTYDKISSGGRGVVFRVDELSISRSGLDLDARIDPDVPVQLSGVDMPFRFASGGLSIKRNEIQAFSIKGAGQLPPELIGEANASIMISMGRGEDGGLIVQSAEATLDKSNDPIVCHGTRFTLTLSAIGLQFEDFSSEGAGYHFYFTLTGSAEFKPREGEFTDGLLKNLGSLTITLDKAPLARDASMLLRAIEFQIAVVPKKRINFFNLFEFELRGIGFHPASPAFGGKPAMSISGQVNFVEAGDIVSPRFDFHKLWIAPPKDGESLPQVRCDGLTVGVRFGGSVSIEATAIAVDGDLPSLYKPGALPANVTARGFLASGKLTIKGWGQMAAAMGFLELAEKDGDVRQAFFIYGQGGELSIEIPTPLGPIYLREVGFGFGYRFTLAAFNRADKVHNVTELISVLDDISKYQGELATVTAWEPEAEGNRLTLALRGLISITSASGETEYNESAEKELSNPVLFDIVAALRSDLTFFLNARVWIARNYADWHDSSAAFNSWRTNPTLRGYVYLSVPRKEFLARMIADGTGDVEGQHPKLPAPLIEAMKAVRWSATTYIRPGLFHQEFGWPYELGFTFKRDDKFLIDCQGGLVNRIEDQSILYGIAFRARGFAQIGGSVGGRSFGASAIARADFAIDAKFIAYLSLRRFNDALFYGSLALDVSISLQVRVWLEFNVGFTDVHLEVGFALSLTISVALEIAVAPNDVGGRACVSLGVGAFGRSLRIGVGFGFNEDMLVKARSRVARFLALGLTVAIPDAEQGVAPIAPEQPRGPAVREADQVIDRSLDKHAEVSSAPDASMKAIGRDLQPSGYWAMLFPVTGVDPDTGDERFVMIFVPRDHSEAGIDLPTSSATGVLGTFYAPPSPEAGLASLSIRFPVGQDGEPPATTKLLITKLEPDPVVDAMCTRKVAFFDTTPVDITYAATRTAFRCGDKEVKVDGFLRQCFVRTGDDGTRLREPVARRIQAESERLPSTREAAAQVLAEAGRDQILLNVEERTANDIEERRSAAIASLCDSAGRLAAGGEVAWNVPATEGLDVRFLGVAFVVNRGDIDQLFDRREGEPRPARFELVATNTSIPAIKGHSVHLFNEPERMFRERGPRLAEPIVEATRAGVRLDWDLEPAFGASGGVWNDPEFNLKHYRIERVLLRGGEVMADVPRRRVTVKSAAPMRLVRDPMSGAFVWRFIRPNAQYVDDLSDLSAALRFAILPDVDHPNVAGDPQDADPIPDCISYIVVPVDTAGTEGAPTPLQLDVVPRRTARPGVRRAVLHVEYRGDNGRIADIDVDDVVPQITIGLDDGADLPLAKGKSFDDRPLLTDGDRNYQVRVRTERGVPTGLYGSDAFTDALARPSAGDFSLKRVSDQDFELKLKKAPNRKIPCFEEPLAVAQTDGYSLSQSGVVDAKNLDQFLAAIGVKATGDLRCQRGPVGVRFAIRPIAKADELPAPWCPMDITMLIDPPAIAPSATGATTATTPKAPRIAVPVEVFEHPVDVDAAPLVFEDLGGDSGRVLIWHPSESGSLGALLSSLDESQGHLEIKPIRDPERRVATRLRWNGRPAGDDPDSAKPRDRTAKRLSRWFGGFDVFETDVAGEVEGATSTSAAAAIRYKFSAKVDGAAPEKGMIKLDVVEQSRATALRVDLRDASGNAQGDVFDLFNESTDRVKGQVRLVKEGDPNTWLTFDLLACISRGGYGRIDVICTDASGTSPFVDKDAVVLLFARLPARHVARVQALPAQMATLDPPEIADFAKVEAHYPSDTRRLSAIGAGRRGAWYSPAESFVEWPKPTLRRALAINVDETILVELLSKGRPKRFAPSLKVGEVVYTVTRQSRKELDDSAWTASKLRDLLQDLTWDTRSDEVRKHHDEHPEAFRNAEVIIKAFADGDMELVTSSWTIDLDPPLHPVLADTIDWARYAATPLPECTPLGLSLSKLETVPTDAELLACDWVEFELADWPDHALSPDLGIQWGSESTFHASTRFVFPTASTASRRGLLDDALQRVAWRLPLRARAELARRLEKNPGTFSAVNCILTLVHRSDAVKNVTLSHPVNVAAVAAARSPSTYRRYEPVIEPLPKVGATDVAGWFGETPVDRDPHGWGILRTLGLGAGLRLFDTEERRYLTPVDTLRTLKLAMSRAIRWYEDLPLGAPFVDIVTRAGGTMRLASFDGGMPAPTPDDVKRLCEQEALALTQISLRPIKNRWLDKDPDGKTKVGDAPVAYCEVVVSNDTGDAPVPSAFVIDISALDVERLIVVDVLSFSTDITQPRCVTLSNYSDAKAAGLSEERRTELRDKHRLLTDDGGEQSRVEIVVPAPKTGEVVALLRITVLEGNAYDHLGSQWIDEKARKWLQPSEIAVPQFDSKKHAFGRFGDMSPERFALLARHHDSVKESIHRLRDYATRRWPKGWPQGKAGSANDLLETALLARIPGWTNRFFVHSPAIKPTYDIQFSIAEITRPDPWRVAVQDDGTMEILLTHDDRKRRLRRYAIRPFGRYETFVAAARGGDDTRALRPPSLLGAWSDGLLMGANGATRVEESWSRRHFDVVIPRTEPLSPPVLVDAKRVEYLPKGEGPTAKTRHALEFIYKRHSEELLSEANVTAEGALSFESVSVGFWREFPMQRWANDLAPFSGEQFIDASEQFGDVNRWPEPKALIDTDDDFGGLADKPGRYTDGWRGSLVLRSHALPFFYRIHAAAFASAGVVVSDPVVATVEEGHFELNLPWQRGVLGELTPGPHWSVIRSEAEQAVLVAFQLPLVRFVDGISVVDREIWLSKTTPVPKVFTLPDPIARYQIRTMSDDAAGRASASGELEVIGEQRMEGNGSFGSDTGSRYRANVVGSVFEKDSAKPGELRRCDGTVVHWHLPVFGKLQGTVPPVDASFAPTIELFKVDNGVFSSPLLLVELGPDAFAADAVWKDIAPRSKATVKVYPATGPNPAAIKQFKDDLTNWLNVFRPYSSDAAAMSILEFLQECLDSNGVVLPRPTLEVQDFTLGLPWFPRGNPAFVSFSLKDVGGWRDPVRAGIVAREALRDLRIVDASNDYDEGRFIADVLVPVSRELRRVSVARKELEVGNRFHSFPSYSAPIPATAAGAALKVGLSNDSLPASVGIMVAVPISVDPVAHHAEIVNLIRMMEQLPFTASALAELGLLEDGKGCAAVHFPCSALRNPQVQDALNAFPAADPAFTAAEPTLWRAVSLLLRMPPTDDERDALRDAIKQQVTDVVARNALLEFADTTMEAQVFGAGRRPDLKVFRGSAIPVVSVIERATRGAMPCP